MRKILPSLLLAMAAGFHDSDRADTDRTDCQRQNNDPACLYKAATENPQLKAPAKAAEGRKFDSVCRRHHI